MLLKHFSIRDSEVFFLDEHRYMSFEKPVDLENPHHKKILINEGIIIPSRKRTNTYSGKKILVVEPHLDDCALSCTGYILNALETGNQVTLLNLFSKATLDTFPWKNVSNITEQEYENLRLYESNVFCNYIGLKFESYRLPQAMTRGHNSPFTKLNSIDEELTVDLSKRLRGIIPDYDIVIYPMAIQKHIDHLITYNALDRLDKSAYNNKFIIYEEYPYANNKIAYTKRLAEVMQNNSLKYMFIPVDKNIDTMATGAVIYRSQFDDINKKQMLALFQDRCRAVTQEGIYKGLQLKDEFHQRMHEVLK